MFADKAWAVIIRTAGAESVYGILFWARHPQRSRGTSVSLRLRRAIQAVLRKGEGGLSLLPVFRLLTRSAGGEHQRGCYQLWLVYTLFTEFTDGS